MFIEKIIPKKLDSFKYFSGLCNSFHLVFWGLLAVSRASVLAAFFYPSKISRLHQAENDCWQKGGWYSCSQLLWICKKFPSFAYPMSQPFSLRSVLP